MSIPYNPNSNPFGEPQGTTDGTFITPILIGDEVNGNTPQPTTDVSGNQVSAALEVQSTEGALLLPRMITSDYKANTFISANGMLLYDVNTNSINGMINGTWQSLGNGSAYTTLSVTIPFTTEDVLTLGSSGIELIAPGAYSSEYPDGYVIAPIFCAIFAPTGGVQTAFSQGSSITVANQVGGIGQLTAPTAGTIFINPIVLLQVLPPAITAIYQNPGVYLTLAGSDEYTGGPSTAVNMQIVMDYKVIPVFNG